VSLPVEITQKKKLKRASASIRDGKIKVQVPQWWSKASKEAAINELVQRLENSDSRQKKLLNSPGERITLHNLAALTAYVTRINHETFNAPVGKIRMGWSKYSQLAQLNLQSRTLTISKYCLTNVPEAALRYLVVHELAHCYEANHSRRFWALVAQHVPDYKYQSKVIKAVHQQAVHDAEAAHQPTAPKNKAQSPQAQQPNITPLPRPKPWPMIETVMQQLKFW